jgi:glutamine synthetase
LSREDVIEALKSGRIDYVRVEFIDLLGNVRGRSLRRAEFEILMLKESGGVPYAESLVLLDYKDTPVKSRYEDVIAVPDPSTFIILPYLERTARVLSYLNNSDQTPYPLCSRGLLRRALQKLEELGFRLSVAFEPTFYLIRNENGVFPADYAKAFSPEGLMEEQNFLRDVIKYLEAVGIQVEMVNKHYGPGQYEITFSKKEALEAADSLITAREVIRDTARLYKYFATYMPKPFADRPGSSMDIYFMLEDSNGKPLIDLSDNKGIGLNKVVYNFIGGVLEHLGAIISFAAPTINSYKRFRELITPNLAGIGTERHFIIRVPSNFKDTGLLEFRLADPLANSYLLLSSIIFAGIDGIERNLDVDVNSVTAELPKDINDALNKLERDNYLKYSLGNEIVSSFVELKKREIESYNAYITPWELDAYLKAGW